MNGIKTLQTTIDYMHDFDAEWYLETYYTSLDDGDFLNFILRSFHDVFNSGSLRGKTLLDIGTGPSIHSIISASSYFDEIYLTDYAECNRKILKEWKDGKRQNGLVMCDAVIGLENNRSKQTKEERSEEIRRKIKRVLPVDITKTLPLNMDDTPDTITSCLCLEAAATSMTEYRKLVRNIGSLLQKGGNLVVVGVLNQSFYRVGDFKFLCLSINKHEIQGSFRDNGFDIKYWDEYCPPDMLETDPEFSDFQTAFVMHAVKL